MPVISTITRFPATQKTSGKLGNVRVFIPPGFQPWHLPGHWSVDKKQARQFTLEEALAFREQLGDPNKYEIEDASL